MKTTLTLFLSLLFIGAIAQIPNNGFENWTTVGTYKNPDGWATMNDFTGPLGTVTCERGTPGSPGTAYMKLTAKNVLGMGVVQGFAITGAFDTAMNIKSGFPYNARPTYLTGKWQFMAYGNDQGMIGAVLTKWNTASLRTDTIAVITYLLPGMVMSWGNFSLPFLYSSSEMPDSATIVAITSLGTPVANSYVYLDNLNFTFAVGIDENADSDKFIISPNPATDKLTVTYNATETALVNISIFDLNGKLVDEFNPGYSTRGENREIIGISDLSSGSYLLKLTVGTKVLTDKLLIK